jgi:geranylgeranyl reductase
MYDLIIIGAGPAGATLARLLGKDNKILLIDRRRLDQSSELGAKNGFEKACGGLIAPDAQQMLARMGLGVPRGVLVSPQLFTVRTIDVQNKLERYYQRHYININREKFDSWLVSLLPPEVDLALDASWQSFEQTPTGIKVKYTQAGQVYEVWTKFLVGADGAASGVRRRLGSKIETRKYISIQEWFQVKESSAYYSAIFDREISDFYAWTIPKEDFLLVGAALLPSANAPQKFELFKEKLNTYGFELQKRVKREGAFILRPTSSRQIYLGQGSIALIGEAAGWISPTSAEGLSYAFRSALALAASYQENRSNPAELIKGYAQNTKGLKMNINLKNLKAPVMFANRLRKLAMQSGFLSIDIQK